MPPIIKAMHPQSEDALLPGLRGFGCRNSGSERLLCQMHGPLQKLITGAGHLFYSVERMTGKVVWHGQGPEDLLGVSQNGFTMIEWQSRVVDHVFVDGLEGRDRHEAQAAFWEGKIDAWTSEFAFQRPDGQVRWVMNHMTPVLGADGTVIGGMGFITDIQRRVDKRRALKRAEDKAEGVIRSSPIAIITFEQNDLGDACLTGWNPASRPILGFDLDAFVGKSIKTAFADSLPPEAIGCISQVAVHGGTWDGSFSIGCPPEERSFELRAFCSEPGHIVCFISDDTEAFRSSQRLKESETKYRGLVETISAGLFTIGADGLIAYASPGLGSLLEEGLGDLIGRSFLDLVAPEHVPMVDRVLYRISRGGSEAAEYKALTAQGERRWVRGLFQPAPDHSGLISGVLLDINDRKKSESAVMAAEERMRLILDAVGGKAAIIDAEGRYTYATPQWAAAFGFACEAEMIGRSGFNFLNGQGEALAREILLQAVMAKNRDPIIGCMDVLTEDSRILHTQFTVVPMLDHPLIEGLVCRMEILEDRTEGAAA